MKPHEALQLIDQALSLLQVNRESHVKLQEAIEIIKKELAEKKK